MVAFEVLAIPVVHDAVWVIERAVEIRSLVATEHVVLDPIKVPVVGWSRQVPYHLTVVGTQYSWYWRKQTPILVGIVYKRKESPCNYHPTLDQKDQALLCSVLRECCLKQWLHFLWEYRGKNRQANHLYYFHYHGSME